MRELLERIGGWRGRWGVGLYGPHELLVSLARLEGKAALGQGGEGAGGTLCLSLSKPEQSQGHLRGGARVRGAEPGSLGRGLTLRDTSSVQAGPGLGAWQGNGRWLRD